eukprot:GHVT01077364.1.p2 GENE.GHVT01077364.1~~GHVT01077364.1.p2  ORF type:complete len:109 (-),score=20.18 GHVT01077364.1:960-1286(-)
MRSETGGSAASEGERGGDLPAAVRIDIKHHELPDGLRKDAEEQAIQALETCRRERDIADHLKRFFDATHSPTWNCIVGRYFGSYVTHEAKRYIYFSVGHLSVLLWKCG